jgi:creatinine amidohydrolase
MRRPANLPRAMVGQMLAAALLAAMCAASVPAQAQAQAPDTVQLERLTWTEIRDAVRSGKTTIIIPVGGTEQSGPYIAVGKHNVRVAALSNRIALRLGNALVAPVIAYVPEGDISPSSSHMRFPGTISVPTNVFEQVVQSASESFRIHGFRNIVLLGDHGGYQAALKQVADTLNRNWAATGAHAIYVGEYYESAVTGFNDALRARGYGADIGTHADLNDTSLMLAVDPSMVRLRALQAAPKPDAAQGVYGGDPRKASAELGRIGTDGQVEAAVQAIGRATVNR